MRSFYLGQSRHTLITNSFMLDGLPNLESVTIGDNSFQEPNSHYPSSDFSISSCSKLKRIGIGKNSLVDFNSFDISFLRSLLRVEIDSNSLVKVKTVLAKGLESLEQMSIAEGSLTMFSE